MSAPHFRPLSDAELDLLEALLDELTPEGEVPISLEWLDGYIAALAAGPRPYAAADWLPRVLGATPGEAQALSLLDRHVATIATALAAPIERLDDPRAYSPLWMDWGALLADLPPGEAETARSEGVPLYGELWAAGFISAVEDLEEDWALPAGSKDEAFVDACLDPFYTLVTPPGTWTIEEKKLSRDAHLANALWGAYDLFEFWRDRGLAPRTPIRVKAAPGRNDPCPCGSGKKYKKCCGADPALH